MAILRQQSTYTLEACENLIQQYYEKGGESVTIEEGCLGLGLTVCYGDGLKTAVIAERYVNEWTSTHTIRMYNKMPKKYEAMIDEYYEKLGEL